jgi:hypothetical protein
MTRQAHPIWTAGDAEAERHGRGYEPGVVMLWTCIGTHIIPYGTVTGLVYAYLRGHVFVQVMFIGC